MRFAVIIGQLSDDKLAAICSPNPNAGSLGCLVQVLLHQTAPVEALLRCYAEQIPSTKPTGTSWYGTLGIGPHTDDVVGDVTIGVVAQGDHYLFTGNRRKVGDLRPGTVFLLHNKRLHGALPRDKKHPTPLVFAAMDVSAEYASAYRALTKLEVGAQTHG